ncbi:hypothetical protein [Streptomyces sp. A1136]|uniref:hypothetical protein n=1 Tax=Streptomyces sp. A1136 TaxID=2563102 RepID=UPI00109E6EA0|nr:hypothetical protein [Streptomyces sp. A1136]THA56139.1 hypothetical protein E6R62_12405 [Streptomyces sp. A1136]
MSDVVFQPGRTYTDGNGYKAPEITTYFHVEHVTRHPERGHLRAIGWSKSVATDARWRGDFRDEDEADGWTELSSPLLPSEPLVVRRVDCSIEPDRDSGETEMLVCCVAEDGRPVALLLDDEARAKLAGVLGISAPAASGPGLDERALRLADHILNTGGVWTTGKAHRWVTSAIVPKPPIHFTRHSLQALAVHGYLRERREPGRVSYTPNYPKGGC